MVSRFFIIIQYIYCTYLLNFCFHNIENLFFKNITYLLNRRYSNISIFSGSLSLNLDRGVARPHDFYKRLHGYQDRIIMRTLAFSQLIKFKLQEQKFWREEIKSRQMPIREKYVGLTSTVPLPSVFINKVFKRKWCLLQPRNKPICFHILIMWSILRKFFKISI